jgi:DNA-binding YbaB/EbfC family protein
MFKGISGLAHFMKQAQEIQGRVGEIQQKLAQVRVEGSAGGGMVNVVADGQQRVVSCRIEEQLLKAGDREMLEDLVTSAVNQALDRAKTAAADEMSGMLGGIQVPGLDEALSKLGLTGGPG